jgi:hypothetical protein
LTSASGSAELTEASVEPLTAGYSSSSSMPALAITRPASPYTISRSMITGFF